MMTCADMPRHAAALGSNSWSPCNRSDDLSVNDPSLFCEEKVFGGPAAIIDKKGSFKATPNDFDRFPNLIGEVDFFLVVSLDFCSPGPPLTRDSAAMVTLEMPMKAPKKGRRGDGMPQISWSW